MKRSEMIKELEKIFDIPRYPKDKTLTAKYVLDTIEKLGMKPPSVSEEDAQAIMRVYIGGNFNQWDEDIAKDQKVQESKRRWNEARADKRPLKVRLAESRAKIKAEHEKRIEVIKAENELIKKLNDTTDMKERIKSSPNIDLSEFDEDE